jgi:hypothetical protein
MRFCAINLVLGAMVLAACGSSGPATSDGGGLASDGGSPPADAPAPANGDGGCVQVCWQAVPRLANPEEGETEVFVSEECRCPDGFACSSKQTISTGVTTRTGLGGYHDPAVGEENVPTGRGTATYQVCEPIDRGSPARMTFDFQDGAPLLPVTLRFRRAGGEWPASSVPGSAGELTIAAERPRAPLVLPLPTDASGALKVMLPRGRYAVQLQMGRGPSFDPFAYPISTLAGTLTVERAGEVIIDVPATPLTFDVRMAGAPFPVPRAGESVSVRIEGRYGLPGISSNLFSWKRAAGQPLERGTVWLEPGKYTVTVTTEGALQDPSLPSGFVIATRFLEIGAMPVERTFDLKIVTLEGPVTVDGKDLPADARGEVDLAGKDAVARALIGSARPARYEVLAYAGRYDLTLETETGAAGGVPDGGMLVFHDELVDHDLMTPIAATTLPWSAEVTVNGSALPAAMFTRGTLVLDGGASQAFSLGSAGPGAVSGLIYRAGAAGMVRVVGAAGGPLPPMAMTVATDFTPSSTPGRFDVVLAPMTIGLRIDAGDPPASTSPRGQFRFARADDPSVSVRTSASMDGPLAAVMMIPPGTWRGTFQSASGAAGLPAGELVLPDLIVPPEGLQRTVEISSTDLAIEVRRDGVPLPDAAAGKDRGAVQVGATRLRLPRTGPASLVVKVFPGVTSVALICDDTCGAGLPSFLTVVPRVRVGP